MLTGAVPWPADRAAAYRRAGYWSGETLADHLKPTSFSAFCICSTVSFGMPMSAPP